MAMITEIGDHGTTTIDKEEGPIILTMTPTEALETQAKEAIGEMIEDHTLRNPRLSLSWLFKPNLFKPSLFNRCLDLKKLMIQAEPRKTT